MSFRSKSRDNHLGEGDWTELFKEGMKIPFEAGCSILEEANAFSALPPLTRRFLDSLQWFGDAVSERSVSAKILKYVTALEQLTGTGKEKIENTKDCGCEKYRSVTEIVAKRSALLYCGQTRADFGETISRFKKIYGVRSDLTHGAISPSDEKCSEVAVELAEKARVVLMNGLCCFDFLGLDSLEMTNQRLKAYFNKFEDEVVNGFFEKSTDLGEA